MLQRNAVPRHFNHVGVLSGPQWQTDQNACLIRIRQVTGA